MPQTMQQKRENAITGYRRAIERWTKELENPRLGKFAAAKVQGLQNLVICTHKRITNG